jgi:hypothetical protein
MAAILGLRMSCAATVATQTVATQKAMTGAAKLQTRNVALRGKDGSHPRELCSQYRRPDQGCQGETATRARSHRANLAIFMIASARCLRAQI